MPRWDRRPSFLDDPAFAVEYPEAIRAAPRPGPTLDQLVRTGSLSAEAADYLTLAIRGGANTLISGPTASGRTTFLGALGRQLDGPQERIVTIEEHGELGFGDIVLEPQPMDEAGLGEVTIRDLLRNAIRMHPTRIVLGELRGAEAFDLLLAMNAGIVGSMCTIHGRGAMAALQRLRAYVMMAAVGPAAPAPDAIGDMIAETLHVIVQLRQDPATARREVASVCEVADARDPAAALPGFITREMFARRAGALAWTGAGSGYGALLRRGLLYDDGARREPGARPWLAAA